MALAKIKIISVIKNSLVKTKSTLQFNSKPARQNTKIYLKNIILHQNLKIIYETRGSV